MNVKIITYLVLTLLGVSLGQYGRTRTSYPLHNICRDSSCSCSCDDLTYLITLVRALEDKETPIPVNNCSIFNAEELVMKLVNALIEITTHALTQNKCHCPTIPYPTTCDNNNMNPTTGNNNMNPTGNNNMNPSTGNNNMNPSTGNNNMNPIPTYVGGSSYSNPDGGLLNVDLLNPNRKDNVLGVDVANQPILGVGLGGGGSYDGASQGSMVNNEYKKSNGQNINSGKTNEGLVNIDLLNPNKKNNVADIDLARQHLIGVGLGDGPGNVPTQTTPVPSNNEGMKNPNSNVWTNNDTKNGNNINTNKGSNSGEGLIDLSLLNPNKPGNVANLDIAHQNILGVELGDHTP